MTQIMENKSRDDAIAVLRATRDGEDLSSSDLALLEHVVNYTIDGLTPAGVQRWNAIVASTKAGTYERPWFHGVEHLTRAPGGPVYWKGVEVEHFTYSDAQKEKDAAVDLGLACSRLEALGKSVNSRGLFELWDRARWASDVPGAKRWVAFISVEFKRSTLFVVDASHCETIRQCQDEVIAPHHKEHDPMGAGRIQTCLIANKDDFEMALVTLRGAFAWALRAYSTPPICSINDMEDDLRRKVSIDELATYEEAFAAAVGIAPRPERMKQETSLLTSAERGRS